MVNKQPHHHMYNMIEPRELNDKPYNVPMSQIKDIPEVPTNYEEEFCHPDLWCRERWPEAITLELNKMKMLKVWHTVQTSSIPKDKKCIKNK
jgi:hypothetical protein